jgi:hypothetical protein
MIQGQTCTRQTASSAKVLTATGSSGSRSVPKRELGSRQHAPAHRRESPGHRLGLPNEDPRYQSKVSVSATSSSGSFLIGSWLPPHQSSMLFSPLRHGPLVPCLLFFPTPPSSSSDRLTLLLPVVANRGIRHRLTNLEFLEGKENPELFLVLDGWKHCRKDLSKPGRK